MTKVQRRQRQQSQILQSAAQSDPCPRFAPSQSIQPAVGKQSEMGGAAAIKKRFNFRHTEVQFCHARKSDNYPRSTEILQINQ